MNNTLEQEKNTSPNLEFKVRKTLQWWRVPLMAALVLTGIYAIPKTSILLYVGMVVTLFGEYFQLWAASQLKKDKVLSSSGPYAHVRNPMYFGRFHVLLGFTFMIQNYILIGIYVLVFAYYVSTRVGREEARLREIFGEDYINYCKEVPRFFPRFKAYSKTSGKTWQWSQIVANHEYLNLVAIIFVYAVIMLKLAMHPGWHF